MVGQARRVDIKVLRQEEAKSFEGKKSLNLERRQPGKEYFWWWLGWEAGVGSCMYNTFYGVSTPACHRQIEQPM